jgi:hypothetical protein
MQESDIHKDHEEGEPGLQSDQNDVVVKIGLVGDAQVTDHFSFLVY